MAAVSDVDYRRNGSCGYFSSKYLMIGRQNEAVISNDEVKLSLCSSAFEAKSYSWGIILPILPIWDSRLRREYTQPKELTISNLSSSDVIISSILINDMVVPDEAICINLHSNGQCTNDSSKQKGVPVSLSLDEFVNLRYEAFDTAIITINLIPEGSVTVKLKESTVITNWLLSV